MRRGHAHSLSFERAVTFTLVAAGAAALVVGCGSISVVSDGGSGAGGHIDVTTGSGGATGDGGHAAGGSGAGGSGAGGKEGGTGGATGSGGASTGGATGSGGKTATGGATGSGGASTGGATGSGGSTGTPDAGVDRGCICPTVVAPVCGSDGMTYNNSCLAGCAGVTVAHTGACVVTCTAVRGCCSMDSDCNANEECAGSTLCGANGRANGVCKTRPGRNSNRCWTDADCAGQNMNNNTCTGAVICPCNAVVCPREVTGTCN